MHRFGVFTRRSRFHSIKLRTVWCRQDAREERLHRGDVEGIFDGVRERVRDLSHLRRVCSRWALAGAIEAVVAAAVKRSVLTWKAFRPLSYGVEALIALLRCLSIRGSTADNVMDRDHPWRIVGETFSAEYVDVPAPFVGVLLHNVPKACRKIDGIVPTLGADPEYILNLGAELRIERSEQVGGRCVSEVIIYSH